ncbi:hypothetical protein KP509_27G042700 [Ceratopteris richardii]|nr:hypothetical protein KP509_27G042700 [Ceratopteris richardii]KAH7295325.1 hypothetical protein KP509_27G042700 [Ceratopteris richardii]
MPKRTVKIKRIENAATRQITLLKRRAGLFKKAHDLSVLCEAEVAIIIFSEKGKLFEFARPRVERLLKRFVGPQQVSRGIGRGGTSRGPSDGIEDRLPVLRDTLERPRGDVVWPDLEGLTIRDLIPLEQQVNDVLRQVRAKKEELLLREIETCAKKADQLMDDVRESRRKGQERKL